MSFSQFDKYLDSFQKYPSPLETENLILNRFNFDIDKPSDTKLIQPSEGLFIDVTHTVHYPYNSGIQRVVRQLVKSLRSKNYPYTLIKFSIDGQPIKLSETEMDKFYNWEKYIHSPDAIFENTIWKIFKRGIPFVKKLIPSSYWAKLKRIYHLLKEKKQSNESLLNLKTNNTILDLRNKKLLLPEVTTESERVHAISILSKYYKTEISCILYDLIPVTHPEFCTVGYDFIHYLRIFRSIKKVFSISDHSLHELQEFNKISPREVSTPLEAKTIYLGGDFQLEDNTPITSSEKKTILMVARFEPRKNIRRVLSALELLYKERSDFKFVIVGNPGWLQEYILEDLQCMKEKGYDIEFHMKIPDFKLVEWYKKCYFTIFCSITEGFGLPIIESVLLGKPCITTNSGSQSEVAKKIGGCILVDPFDIQDIYSKVKDLLTNESLYLKKVSETKNSKWPSWDNYAEAIYKAVNNNL